MWVTIDRKFFSVSDEFTTMLTGPRISADDVTPSYGCFNLQKRKIYTVLYNNIHRQY
jgi:hypothetical protein